MLINEAYYAVHTRSQHVPLQLTRLDNRRSIHAITPFTFTNQVSYYVGNIVVVPSVATLALVPAVDTTITVATNALFPTTYTSDKLNPSLSI